MAMAVVPKFESAIYDENLEIFGLIWLDAEVNISEHNLDAQNKLRAVINHLKTFEDVDNCRKYIAQVPSYHRLVFIVSGHLGQETVPRVHHLNQISTIYVYCLNKQLHEEWAKKFTKVKAVIVELDDLISKIRYDQKYLLKLAESLSFNIFDFNTLKFDQSTNSLNGEFVHNQVLLDVLLRIKYAEKDKNELINLCKVQYKDNTAELRILEEFQISYSCDTALWWYTRECFLYKILNKALRVQDIHVLFLLRSFSADIYQQLKQCQCQSQIQVYRGQLVSKDELTSLRASINQLISINSFFSTTLDLAQALIYLNSNDIPSSLERVLFDIDADPSVANVKPFADISLYSAFGNESEVLFMFGSIFRLNHIHRENNGVWIIKMTLYGDSEHDLKQVLEEMKNEYGNKRANLHLLGTVLWKMGKSDLAEKYYHRLINELTPNDRLLIDLYKDLSDIASMKGDLDASVQWKKKSLEIKAQATSSGIVAPRMLVPTAAKNIYYEIEKRIAQVTDSNWKPFDATQIQNATREERMMAVAWIMVCRFDCRLYGGFVRDWIVDHTIGRPKNKTIDQWILYDDSTPYFDQEVVPADLDCYLPAHGLYDIDKVVDELGDLQMSVRVYRHHWRYVLLVDQTAKTGPFMIDLITPHVGITTYDRIDFDVNDLFIEKDLTKHLGIRMDISFPPYSCTLEKIVNNIQNKQFYLLAEINDEAAGKIVGERAEKMKVRGWKRIAEDLPPLAPSRGPPKHVGLTPIPNASTVYKTIEQQMKQSFGADAVEILSIEQVKNIELEKIYEQAKKIVQKESATFAGNEMMLFHGTKGNNIAQILNYGFDEQSYRQGNWGKGAYFSNNPKTEHLNTFANTEDNKRVMYQTKVLLGKVREYKNPKIKLYSAPENYHSVHGIFPLQPNSDEYIVYRYGQALPHLKITYKS